MNKIVLIAQSKQFFRNAIYFNDLTQECYVPTFYDNTKETVITKRTVN